MKSECIDLYVLSTLACQLAECVDKDDLPILAASLTTLGDMIAVIITKQELCNDKDIL